MPPGKLAERHDDLVHDASVALVDVGSRVSGFQVVLQVAPERLVGQLDVAAGVPGRLDLRHFGIQFPLGSDGHALLDAFDVNGSVRDTRVL